MSYEAQSIRHPLLYERNQLEFEKKLKKSMIENNINSLILLRPENVFYATGYYRSPTGLTIAVINEKGKVKLIVNDNEYESALAIADQDVEVHLFSTWLFVDDGTKEAFFPKNAIADSNSAMKNALELVDDNNEKSIIGIEREYINANLWEFLINMVGKDRLRDNTTAMMNARMLKTDWEIDILRKAAQHSEKMMQSTIELTKPGMTLYEIEKIMNQKGYEFDTENTIINQVMIASAGNQFGISGLPRQMVMKTGDMIRLDGGSVHLGYYSDLARTYVVGGNPSAEQENLYRALYSGYEEGLKMFKPGVKLADIYYKVREVVESSGIFPAYARGHVGHSLGISTAVEEYPQISPVSDIVLEPGMVFSFEVPFYGNKNAQIMTASINIEDTLVVTESGHERFTYANSTLKS